MTTMIERVARNICAADPTAPHPDAPILIGMRPAKAWEARVPMARVAIDAMRYEDGTDEDIFVASAATEKIDPVSLICAYDRVIDAALKEGATMPTCPKCHAEMRKGLAIEQTYAGGLPDFPGGDVITMHAGGPGRLVECLKCPSCGFSRSMGEQRERE